MEGLAVLVIGAFLFAVFGVIALLVKTASLKEENRRLNRRIDELAEKFSGLRQELKPGASQQGEAAQLLAEPEPLRETAPLAAPAAEAAPLTETQIPLIVEPEPLHETDSPPLLRAAPLRETAAQEMPLPSAPPVLLTALISFARRGNYWAAGGIILLAAGFATLITYLARRGFFTLEMGIAAAAFTGMIMLVCGWAFRKKRPVYCLLLQGGGIGIIYLAVFAAFKFTPWFSQISAFALLFALTLPAVTLALLQNSQYMAVLGFAGAFAAPLLVSTGSGNHVFLFSYYLGLNLVVLCIAFFRFWRGVNLAAFAFSYAAALAWLFKSYKPELFWTAEPFFAAFIVVFTALSIHGFALPAYARSKKKSHPPLDGILLLGNPLLGAVTQWRLFSFVPHGHAIISIAFAAFYLALAVLIWKHRGKGTRLFAESYLGLAVLLANLAIPLELSPKITSALWAAEGALFFFLALRLKNIKVVIPALVLHAAAAAAFALEKTLRHSTAPLFRSSAFSGSMVIALAALALIVITLQFAKRRNEETGFFSGRGIFHAGFLTALSLWFYAWLFGGWFVELKRVFPYRGEAVPLDYAELFFGFCAAAVFIALGLAKLPRRPPASSAGSPLLMGVVPSMVFAAALALYAIFTQIDSLENPLFIISGNFFHGHYRWGWPLFFAAHAAAALLAKKEAGEKLRGVWLFVLILISAIVLSSSGRALTLRFGLAPAWRSFAGLLPLFAAMICLSAGRRGLQAMGRVSEKLLCFVLPLIFSSTLGLWFLATLFLSGDPAPLPRYIPLVNPLDLLEAFSILLFLFWQTSRAKSGAGGVLKKPALVIITDTALFLFVTALLARSAHFYAHIPYGDLFDSEIFQLGLFIVWALYGIAHIAAGTRLGLRAIWIAGAALTAADIAKLLLLDLAGAGAVIRIISFFAAGLILLFIGWVSPLPPAAAKGSLK